MEIIKSKDNKTIKYISKLIKSSKFRKEENSFVVEGVRMCEEALKNNAVIEYLVYSVSSFDKHTDIIKRLTDKAFSTYCVEDRIFCALSDTKTPQGVLCVVKTLDKQAHFDTIKKNGILLALDNIQDPTNLGTILRSADALGISGVILSSDCCDVYSPKVTRGSMGAIFRMPFYITKDLPAFIASFNEHGTSYACVLDDAATKISEVKFTAPVLSVIGNEGNGISFDVINACNKKLYIPMYNNAESLNAAVAASIIMWEMSK
ncbi:MAG: RNA methyltransferase [Ruminococcaceae bacterium]|nr:RNA methyltransferase [Oscillospiraceae bacterium]